MNENFRREYRQSGSGDEYNREREVERFYRGSSKERRTQYQQQEQYPYEKRGERYDTLLQSYFTNFHVKNIDMKHTIVK